MFTDRQVQPVSCNFSEDLQWSKCPSPYRCVPRRCVIPYKRFSITEDDKYSFHPDRDLGIQLTVSLAQYGKELGPCSVYRRGQITGGGLE